MRVLKLLERWLLKLDESSVIPVFILALSVTALMSTFLGFYELTLVLTALALGLCLIILTVLLKRLREVMLND